MEHQVNEQKTGGVVCDRSYHVSELANICWPEIALTKIIIDIPLGDPDRYLLGISLPDPLKNSRQAGVKLNCLEGEILV